MASSKFNLGDYVMYKDQIYLVKSIIYMNPNILSDPFVCGLVPLTNPNGFTQFLVREALLTLISTKKSRKATKVLYGN